LPQEGAFGLEDIARLELRASNGDVNSQYYLGWLYGRGEGVRHDFARAALWYQKAADQGDLTSQTNLGWLYVESRGVPQDYELIPAFSGHTCAVKTGPFLGQIQKYSSLAYFYCLIHRLFTLNADKPN
jgi:hypothetical protein